MEKDCTAEIRLSIRYKFEEDLNPEDFTKCNTLQQLKYEVENKLIKPKQDSLPESYVEYRDLILSNDFINKWKSLVGFIEGNVMTKSWAEMWKKRADEVTTYYGDYLNSQKHNGSFYTFRLGDYQDFHFKEDKKYRCYVSFTDRYDSQYENLLFAEEI